jgi:hypothetical protein
MHERALLNFVRQVAVTLERASLYGKENAHRRKYKHQPTGGGGTRAATQNLTKLLEQIRSQISGQFDVSNFSIFLYNEQTNTLDFKLLYENGAPKKETSRVADNGMEEYMLSQKGEIHAQNVREFAGKRNHPKRQPPNQLAGRAASGG